MSLTFLQKESNSLNLKQINYINMFLVETFEIVFTSLGPHIYYYVHDSFSLRWEDTAQILDRCS